MLTILTTIYPLIGMPGGSEWIIIIMAIILFFGGKKIPELMKGIGKGVREFNDAKNSVQEEIKAGMQAEEKNMQPVIVKEQA